MRATDVGGVERSFPAGRVANMSLLGGSPVMRALRDAVKRAASASFSVLVEGESGTGKELVARALHQAGPRRSRPFAAINCAAVADELLETELFGHARGAFTGAVAARQGLFEATSGGTLLLDEVGELSPRAQAKLLRALQEGEIRKVGENLPRRVDVRVVAASNRSLRAEARAGRFRHDLLYRLDLVRLEVPPLRERGADVVLLVDHFWRGALAQTGKQVTLASQTVAALSGYAWPGNVRELQNVMAALAVEVPPRGRVEPEALPAPIQGAAGAVRPTLDEARRQFDRQFVQTALGRAPQPGGARARPDAAGGWRS